MSRLWYGAIKASQDVSGMKRAAEEPPGSSKALDGCEGKQQMAAAATRRVCWNWAKGVCRYGASCRFSHATSAPSTPQVMQHVQQRAELPAQLVPGSVDQVARPEERQKRHSLAGTTTRHASMLATPQLQQQPGNVQSPTSTAWRDRVWSHPQVAVALGAEAAVALGWCSSAEVCLEWH
jgi:hypothetical protein